MFSGDVSLENNVGFSSVQYSFDPIDVTPYRTGCLRVKGDGKTYQFLVEAERDVRHYYVYEFQTSRAWQTIEVPLADMVAAYRGERLRNPQLFISKGETPPGIKQVYRSSTEFSLSVYRTQLFDDKDMDNVKKVQAGYKVQPLSAYLKQPPPPKAPAIGFPKIDKDLMKTNFFDFWISCCSSRFLAQRKQQFVPSSPPWASGLARRSISMTYRPSTRPPSCRR